jgi:hypothetical protein
VYWECEVSDYTKDVMSLGKALQRIRDLELQQTMTLKIIESLQGDAERLDFLEELVEEAYVGSCFELDGGIHLTIERPSSEPEAYRNCNDLREAIDKAMKNALP